MADNVQLNTGVGGAIAAADEIAGVQYQRVKIIHGIDGVNDGDVARVNPLPVDVHALVAPKAVLATSVGLAAGASIDLDSDQIASGKTGKLLMLLVCASVPCKAVLQTVTNGVPSAPRATFFGLAGRNAMLPIPSKHLYQIAHSGIAGFDGFRVTVTNLDNSNAADVYANFAYDEV